MRIVRWYVDRARRQGFHPRWKFQNDLVAVIAIIVLILAMIAYHDPYWVAPGK